MQHPLLHALHALLHAHYMQHNPGQSYYMLHYMPITWSITCLITCSTIPLHVPLHDNYMINYMIHYILNYLPLHALNGMKFPEPMITCFLCRRVRDWRRTRKKDSGRVELSQALGAPGSPRLFAPGSNKKCQSLVNHARRIPGDTGDVNGMTRGSSAGTRSGYPNWENGKSIWNMKHGQINSSPLQNETWADQFQPIAKWNMGGSIPAHCKMKHGRINSSPLRNETWADQFQPIAKWNMGGAIPAHLQKRKQELYKSTRVLTSFDTIRAERRCWQHFSDLTMETNRNKSEVT
jgi:hypothetical protein